MKKLLILLLVGILSAPVCFAAGNSRITLNDGTTIYGKVVGMSDGVYTIHTDSMGDIKVNSDNVFEITSDTSKKKPNIGILEGNGRNNSNSGNSNTSNNNKNSKYSSEQQEVNTRVQSMMMNDNFMDNLMELNGLSEMQSVLNDPEVMEAIQNGDYDFLMNNQKINDLMNSSEIKDILGGM